MAAITRKFVDHLLTFFDDVEVAVGATDSRIIRNMKENMVEAEWQKNQIRWNS